MSLASHDLGRQTMMPRGLGTASLPATPAGVRGGGRTHMVVALIAAFVFGLAVFGRTATAQCFEWEPGDGRPGVDGEIYATTMWDPDGTGPLAPVLVVAGSFTTAGSVAARNIAVWHGRSWSALGPGIDGTVYALAVMANGDLIVGGAFSNAGGNPAHGVARWNGGAWSPVGAGISLNGSSGYAYALLALDNGDLVAGGTFDTAGGIAAASIARWNGAAWVAVGGGVSGATDIDGNPAPGSVRSLALMPGGDVIAGGIFTHAGTTLVNSIARWDGTSWAALGLGIADAQGRPQGYVSALTPLPNGDLAVGGNFSYAGGGLARSVARWNGGNWSAFGPGVPGNVLSLAVMPSGEIVAGGALTVNGIVRYVAARWSGTGWVYLGLTSQSTYLAGRSLTVTSSGDLYVGGSFVALRGPLVSDIYAGNIARVDGTEWFPLSVGFNEQVNTIVVAPDGGLIAGGYFTGADGASAHRIARWDGAGWAPMGTGMDDAVQALAIMPNGDVIAGGNFTVAGGVSARYIARWNGTEWLPLGAGMNSYVLSLAVLHNGDLIAGGSFTGAGGVGARRIARWNGSAWSSVVLGAGMQEGAVHALAVLPSGDLIAGGSFESIEGTNYVHAFHIARYNGNRWLPMGPGIDHPGTDVAVYSLAVTPSGELFAGGNFGTAGGVPADRVARWNGESWSPVGTGTNGSVFALAALPGGGVIAAGVFTSAGGLPASRIARWDGGGWSALAGGTDSSVLALARRTDGEIVAGGLFASADGNWSPYLGRATVVSSSVPIITSQPTGGDVCPHATVRLEVGAVGEGTLSYQWRRNGIPLTGATLPVLEIRDAYFSDTGEYVCTVRTPCAAEPAVSQPVHLRVTRTGDFNGDGFVDFFDFGDFVDEFEFGDPWADFNGDGFIDFFDFDDFVAAFESGC